LPGRQGIWTPAFAGATAKLLSILINIDAPAQAGPIHGIGRSATLTVRNKAMLREAKFA
jgi:hypothetical protein